MLWAPLGAATSINPSGASSASMRLRSCGVVRVASGLTTRAIGAVALIGPRA